MLLLALALIACRRAQTFDEGMHVLCDLPRSLDAGFEASTLALEAERRVTNPSSSSG